MHTALHPAAVSLGLGRVSPLVPERHARRSLLRLTGKVAYWHRIEGKPGTWGVLKSDGKIKFHVHLSEFRNSSRAPAIGQRVEFTPRPPRARGELRRAVDVFIDKEKLVN